jgi:hypothetical protein
MRLGSSFGVLSLAVALWAPLEAEAGQMQLPRSDASQASKTPPAAAQPPTGDFKALGFWKALKLGGAYWVNPSAVRDVRVVYAFDPKDFTAAHMSTDIFALAKTGQVSFGLPTAKDSFKAVTLSDLTSQYKVDDQTSLDKLLTSGNISVIAGQDFLLGAKPTVTLVGTNAE